MVAHKIFICGGGTGGHFFSGLAIAEEILERHGEAEIHFVGTRQGIEGRTALPDARMQVHFITARGLLGKGISAKIQGFFALAKGFVESFGLLNKFRPTHVIGVGGYASAPTVAAALLFPFQRWIVSIVEQNSYAGMSNRVLKFLGARAFSAFSEHGFQCIHLPLRKALKEAAKNLRPVDWPPKTLLIVGGSQGARSLNAKWRELLTTDSSYVKDLLILHQTGAKDEAEMRAFYATHGFTAEVFAFSADMPHFYKRADVVICRAGAMTVFEVMAFKRPALFVPFPAATHDHQYLNAASVQQAEWIVREPDLTSEKLKSILGSRQPLIPQPQAAASFVEELGL